MNTREYYPLNFLLDNRHSYLIWIGDDQDTVLTDRSGKIVCYSELSSLIESASALGIEINSSTPALYNLDRLSRWLDGKVELIPECEELLNAWNLFQDVSASVKGEFDSEAERTNHIYEKLFYGCNLSVVNRSRKKYVPTWTTKELDEMRRVLKAGLALFRQNLILV